MGKKKKRTTEELIEKALDDLQRVERPIGLSLSPYSLAMIDMSNREKRKDILKRLLQDSMDCQAETKTKE